MNKVYLLRTTDAAGRSYGGFQWPLLVGAEVVAPDWDPSPVCGGGLHGALAGEGEGRLLSHDADALWWIVEAEAGAVVDLGGKVKVPRATVVAFGGRLEITERLVELCPGRAVIGASLTAGDAGTATAGDAGTATAGDEGTATAGYAGTATAGVRGTATAGDEGTATAGDEGTATAGYAGTATAGVRGTATAGVRGTATAGDEGTIQIRWYDGKRFRIAIGYVGESGIEANVRYRCEAGQFVKVT